MSGFSDLGLSARLTEAAEATGYDEPTRLQRAAIPVLRRGGNAVLVASPGSGVTAAWGLALLDRLSQPSAADATGSPAGAPARTGSGDDEAISPRALVLTITDERAAGIARSLVRLAGSTTIPIRALTTDWSTHGGEGVLVAPLGSAVRAIVDSSLKLDSLEAIVFDQLVGLMAIESSDVFEALSAALPADTQRVVVTADGSRDVERFVEAHARRALRIPARAADPSTVSSPEAAGRLSYNVVVANAKVDALARALRRKRTEVPVVAVRSMAGARALVDELNARGFTAAAEPRAGAEVVILSAGAAAGAIIAYDVPFDAELLSMLDLQDGLVLVEPAELAHLKSIAAEAGVQLRAVGTRPQRGQTAAFREEVRRAIEERDLDAQIALLEPLLATHTAVEVAAALSALLRERRTAEAPAAEPEKRRDRPPAFVRLFVSAGSRDGIRPGDLVGAITGEASVSGDQIGKIDLRDTFSVVEVAADVAERTIRALNGTTLRGRSLRVDYDRRGATASQSRPPRAGLRSQRN